MQNELQDRVGQDYAQQFLAAVRADMKVKRNEKAIEGRARRGSRQAAARARRGRT